ncbi:MAG: YkgJ family cysteine cluster protein [Candidatus Thorarchaeota archaeon]
MRPENNGQDQGAGLHIKVPYTGECNRCGDCCRQFMVRIPIQDPKRARWPLLFYNMHENVFAEVVEVEDGKYEIWLQIREKCSMLVEHRDGTTSCKIYWMRPPICRVFPDEKGRRGKDLPRCSMLRDTAEEPEEAQVERETQVEGAIVESDMDNKTIREVVLGE